MLIILLKKYRNVYILIISIFFALPLQINASIGLSDWTNTTSQGTEFSSNGGMSIILRNGKQYQNVKKWYFYSGHIVGIGKRKVNGNIQKEYIIIDEENSDLLLFSEKNKWQTVIKEKGLIPKIRTRWFSGEWDNLRMIYLFAYLLQPIAILVAVINLYFIFKVIRTKGKILKWKILAIIIPFLLISLILLGKFPQSF